MSEPDEVGWRIRSGVGLLLFAPLSDARRDLIERETEKERLQAEREAELRADAVAERLGDLRRKGYEPKTQQEFLEQVSRAQDRADAVEARREREAAEMAGQPPPHRPTIWEQKLERQQAHAHAIVEPASKQDVSKLSSSIASLAAKVVSLGRRRSEEQDYDYDLGDSQQPRYYVRNSGGFIVRGPY